jgi:cell division protein FtsB
MLAGHGGPPKGRRAPRHAIGTNLALPPPPWDAADVRRLALLVERVLPVAILVVAVVGAPVLIFSPHGLPRLRALQKELADVEDENADLHREIDALHGRVARLINDPGAVERIARDNLGLVRQTEVVFQFQVKR